jgi:hypothetical protein
LNRDRFRLAGYFNHPFGFQRLRIGHRAADRQRRQYNQLPHKAFPSVEPGFDTVVTTMEAEG